MIVTKTVYIAYGNYYHSVPKYIQINMGNI